MKQIVQYVRSGDLRLETVPPPALQPGAVRVRTAASLISAGTEKMLIDLAQKSLVGMAQSRPDLVKQVLEKVKSAGLVNTFQTVMTRLEKPMPLGYSAAGIIEEVGTDVIGLHVGDRIAVAGAGYANHAEINVVPKNLVAKIPDGVPFEAAAYTTVASIGLQGVRLAHPELGDNVVVIGLGLIGLITVQLLKANGCRVIGLDLDADKVALGMSVGMDDGVVMSDNAVRAVESFTRGRGADHTLITAATKSNGPVELAGSVTRRKGQVVVVGAVGMDIPRDAYYKKELELKVSMSYGPGRYDTSYEEGGVDYPYDYVRWTEQRNMEAVLALLAQKKLDVSPLTSHRIPFDRALDAYALIQEERESYVGVILEYEVERMQDPVVRLGTPKQAVQTKSRLGVGFVGAGNYAATHLIPHVKNDAHVSLEGLVTATGFNSRQKADKFGFRFCSTDLQTLLDDESVDVVFIASRHSTHAEFAARALRAGKHVFVEKPMVVSESQLETVIEAYESAQARHATGLMTGLNRRFAPMVRTLYDALPEGEPRHMVYRVNSGHIPTSTWLHDPNEGGGMLVGEMCHFVDLMQFLAGSRPERVFAHALSLERDDVCEHDNLTLVVSFADGSLGTLCYNTVGDKAASKERVEVFSGGVTAILDDFRRIEITSGGKTRKRKSSSQDKGQSLQIEETLSGFRMHGRAPIPFDELVWDMKVIFAARESLATSAYVPLMTPIPHDVST